MSRRVPLKTFRVSFCALDHYTIDLKACDEDSAIAKAVGLYGRHGEKPFTFDPSQGGTVQWEAKEVAS